MSEAGATRDRVLVEMTIAAPADAVWDALKDTKKIYNWHGWDDPSLTEEIEFIYAQHADYDDERQVLSFRMGDRFEVEAHGDTSVLRVVRTVPADAQWEGVYEDMVEGWISFVQQLRLAIEQHDLGSRRTIYLGGIGAMPSAALGLSDLLDIPQGEKVTAPLPTGDTIDGIAWHRTPFQFGVTMPQWGDGLLIVTDKSMTEDAPNGRGMVILTTYGMADTDFDALKARWTDWWGKHFTTGKDAACT